MRTIERTLRQGLRWLVATAGVLALFLACLWLLRVPLAEFAITNSIAAAGFARSEIAVESIGLHGATVRDIRLGHDAIRISRMRADYRPAAVLAGRVDRLTAEGVQVRARLEGTRLHLDGVAIADGGERTTGPIPSLPVGSLHLTNVAVALETQAGPLDIAVAEATLAATPSGLIAQLTADVAWPLAGAKANIVADGSLSGEGPLDLAGSVHLSAAPAGVAVTARAEWSVYRLDEGETLVYLRVVDGDVRSAGYALEGLSGRAQSAIAAADGAPNEVEIVLAARDARRDGHSLGPARLSLDVAMQPGPAIAGKLQAEVADASLSAPFQARMKEESWHAAGAVAASYRGTPLPTATLDARAAGGTLAFDARIPSSEGELHVSGTRGVAGGDAPLKLQAKGLLSAHWLRWLPTPVVEAEGAVTVDLAAELPATVIAGDRGPLQALQAVSARGDVRVDLHALRVEDVLSVERAAAHLQLSASAGTVAVSIAAPVTVEALRISSPIQERLDAVPGGLGTGPVDVHIEAADPNKPSVSVVLLDGSPAVDLAFKATLDRGMAQVTVATGTVLSFRDGKAFPRITSDTTIDVVKLPFAGHLVSGKAVLKEFELNDGPPSGKVALDGTARLRLPQVSAAPVAISANMTGLLQPRGEKLAVTLGAGSRVTIAPLTDTAGVRTESPIRIQVGPSDGTIVLDPHALAVEAADLALRFPMLPEIALGSAETAHTLQLSIPSVRTRIASGEWQVSLEDAEATLPALAARAQSINLTARYRKNWSFAFSAGRLEHLQERPAVVPLRLEGKAKVEKGLASATVRLADAGGRLILTASAEHGFTTGAGKAEAAIERLTFLPTVLQPRELFPMLDARLQEVDGIVDGKLAATWNDKGIDGTAELLVNLMRFTIADVVVQNATAVLRLDDLFPLRTPGPQTVDVGLIDVGVPLSDGLVDVAIAPDGTVTVELRKLNLFGGRIDSPPVTFDWREPTLTVPLKVTGVQLAELLEIARFGELSATGTLDGIIPIHVDDGVVAIRGGILEGIGGGTIRYVPEAVGPTLAETNEGMRLFLDVIRDFEYDSIRVTLDEAQGVESLTFGFHVAGKNREVYGGAPVQLNVTLEAPVRQLLSHAYSAYTLPERIVRRLVDFGD